MPCSANPLVGAAPRRDYGTLKQLVEGDTKNLFVLFIFNEILADLWRDRPAASELELIANTDTGGIFPLVSRVLTADTTAQIPETQAKLNPLLRHREVFRKPRHSDKT